MAQKTKKVAAKPAAKTSAKAPKLNEVQKSLASALVGAKDDGIAPSTWGGEGRFPTRSLKALTEIGLAKSKEKKNADGKKETFWFPTAKTAKVAEATA